MRTRSMHILVLLFLPLAAGCYTQLHPPLNEPAASRAPAGSTSAAAVDSAAADTLLLYDPYYPYAVYVLPQYVPYYYPRQSRWYSYYNTPWWSRRRPVRTYHPSSPVSTPSAGSTPAAASRPSNRGRKLNIAPPAPTAGTPEAKETAATPVSGTAVEPSGDTDTGDKDDGKETDDRSRKSNRGRKLDF